MEVPKHPLNTKTEGKRDLYLIVHIIDLFTLRRTVDFFLQHGFALVGRCDIDTRSHVLESLRKRIKHNILWSVKGHENE